MALGFIVLFSGSFLVVSLMHFRYVRNFATFALDRCFFGTLPIYCSILASGVGAAVIIGNAERAYQSDFLYTLGGIGFSLQLVMTAWLAPRIYRWRDCLSTGELLGKAYGGLDIRFISGVIWLVFCTGIITAQVIGIQRVIAMAFPDIQQSLALYLVATVIIYSCLGGIRSVVSTDVIQTIVIIASLLLLFYWGINIVGGEKVFLQKLTAGSLTTESKSQVVTLVALFVSFWLGDALIPISMQRVMMARSAGQAQRAMLITAVFFLLVILLAGLLGATAWMIDSTREPQATLSILLNLMPEWLGLLLIAGLLAAVMSSCDSYLNTAAVAFSNDILSAFSLSLSDKQLLLAGRVSTVLIGGLAIVIAYGTHDILDVLLTTFEAWAPTLFPPLLMALFYPRLPKRFFYLPALAGISGLLTWKLFVPLETFQAGSLLTGISASFICFLILFICYKNLVSKRS